MIQVRQTSKDQRTWSLDARSTDLEPITTLSLIRLPKKEVRREIQHGIRRDSSEIEDGRWWRRVKLIDSLLNHLSDLQSNKAQEDKFYGRISNIYNLNFKWLFSTPSLSWIYINEWFSFFGKNVWELIVVCFVHQVLEVRCIE